MTHLWKYGLMQSWHMTHCFLCGLRPLDPTTWIAQGMSLVWHDTCTMIILERLRDWAIDRATERSSDRATDRSSDRAIKRSSDRAIEHAIKRSSDRANDLMIERSRDRSEGWIMTKSLSCLALQKSMFHSEQCDVQNFQKLVYRTHCRCICSPKNESAKNIDELLGAD